MQLRSGVVDARKILLTKTRPGCCTSVSFKVWSLQASFGGPSLCKLLPHVAIGFSELHFISLDALLVERRLTKGLAMHRSPSIAGDLFLCLFNISVLLAPFVPIHRGTCRICRVGQTPIDLQYPRFFTLRAAHRCGAVARAVLSAIYRQRVRAKLSVISFGFVASYMRLVIAKPMKIHPLLKAATKVRDLYEPVVFTTLPADRMGGLGRHGLS
ncbi:MAG: hypothetical protein AAF636_04235 [Pseudomonadota bacterium]